MSTGSPGLCDPCERELVNAAGHLTLQQIEDITSSAQHALRLICLDQMHCVLGLDPPQETTVSETDIKHEIVGEETVEEPTAKRPKPEPIV
jgi:hypothetical protein